MRKIFCLLLVLASGCATGAHLRTADTSRNPATTDPGSIHLYAMTDVGRSYEVVGAVVSDADGGDDSSSAITELKKQAAALGANAVVGLRLEVGYGMWTAAVRASGTAVRFAGGNHQ